MELETQLINHNFDIAEQLFRGGKDLVLLGGISLGRTEFVTVPDHTSGNERADSVTTDAFMQVMRQRFGERIKGSFPANGMSLQEALDHMVGDVDRAISTQRWILEGDTMLEYNPDYSEKAQKKGVALWYLGRVDPLKGGFSWQE